MKNSLNKFLRTILSLALTQNPGNSISSSMYIFKNKNKWIYRFIFGSTDDRDLFENIKAKLGGNFEILMVHSSLNAMLPMYCGEPRILLSLLINFCKERNITLAMPSYFLGSNKKAKEHYSNGKNRFDAGTTISGMGLMTEIFRRMPDVRRSIHPTHSLCALGPLADLLTRDHHIAETTFGEGTPFQKMIKHKTVILGIGTKIHQAMTQVHTAEDILKDEYPAQIISGTIQVKCIDANGETLNYNLRIRRPEFILDVKNVHKILKGKVSEWDHKGIHFILAEADVVTDTVIEAARKGNIIYKVAAPSN